MKAIIVFILSFLTWCLLSGFFDFFHLAQGAVVAFLVSYFLSPLLFASKHKVLKDRLREIIAFPIYAIWILYEIFKANLHILHLAFHPNLEQQINPRIFSVRCPLLTSSFSHYVMGMSITIVAGTVTIDIDGDSFLVHAISDFSAAGLPEPMQTNIAKVFESYKG